MLVAVDERAEIANPAPFVPRDFTQRAPHCRFQSYGGPPAPNLHVAADQRALLCEPSAPPVQVRHTRTSIPPRACPKNYKMNPAQGTTRSDSVAAISCGVSGCAGRPLLLPLRLRLRRDSPRLVSRPMRVTIPHAKKEKGSRACRPLPSSTGRGARAEGRPRPSARWLCRPGDPLPSSRCWTEPPPLAGAWPRRVACATRESREGKASLKASLAHAPSPSFWIFAGRTYASSTS